MSHLTEEQLEGILQGDVAMSEHVEQCSECQARLEEKRAIARRLRTAFSTVKAGPALADRIRSEISTANQPVATGKSQTPTILLHVHHRLRTALAVAAAMLLVAVPTGLYVSTTSQARAAQSALVKIHHDNLNSLDELYAADDPAKLGEYFEGKMGHKLAMPCTGSGTSMCGCCVREFKGQPAGSYVIECQTGSASVIVVPDSPKSLGMTKRKGQDGAGRTIWQASCGGCSMVSVRIGEHSYCAVGQVCEEELTALLKNLLE
jgi:anti-sigma factor RsiW